MKKKLKVIIDSDTANEIDDSFALSYALAYDDVLDVKAITIEPFSVSYSHISPKDSILESRSEANRILRLMGIKDADLVYKGSEGFLSEGYNKISPAAKKIIELAKKGPITILALGVLTNIAIAIMAEPSIAENLDIVWLGTKNLLYEEFDDANYSKDKLAFEKVIKSKCNMTVIPSFIGKFFVTSAFELKKNIAYNDIGKYLMKLTKQARYENENSGVKTVYDVAPVAYVLHPEMFKTTILPANELLREQKKTLVSRKVTYVYDMAPNNVVWDDFIDKISSQKTQISPPRVFFTSNTYFGDEKQVKTKLTPYKTLEEMDEDLISKWNSVVGEKDIVFHLGDFGKYRYVSKLNGKVYLICGNHEKWVYGRHFNDFKQKCIELGFVDVYRDGVYVDKKIFGEKVFMTYRPKDCKKECMNLFGQFTAIGGSAENAFNVSAIYNDFTPVSSEKVKSNFNFMRNAKSAADGNNKK